MTYWLAGKSVLTRIPQSPDGAQWQERIEHGLVRITTATRLEIGFSVRSGAEVRLVQRGRPLSMMPVEYLTPAVEDRAVSAAVAIHREKVNANVLRPCLNADRQVQLGRRSVIAG